jgi:hypothetical protein
MHRILSPIAAALLIALIGGCDAAVDPCKEFDPPPGHKPSTCPPKPVVDKPAQPARYCYSSLAQADCYSEPQPGRTGYMGSTEATPPAAAAPPKATDGTSPPAPAHSKSAAPSAVPAPPATPSN